MSHRKSDRLDEYIRHATQLDPDQTAALGDPVSKRALFEEITHRHTVESEPRRPAQPTRRRLPLAAAASGVAAVALLGGILAASGVVRQQNRPPVVPSATHSISESLPDGRSGDVFPGHAASCVEEYSAATLARRAFAFDGTVTGIGPSPNDDPAWPSGGGPDPYVPVTFTVNRWYRGGDGATITVAMLPPSPSTSEIDTGNGSYQVGSRLLVTGEPRWGGRPLDRPVAWTCGFTRWYTAADAAVWDDVFRK
jgi:hypothetical protein